MVSEERIIEKMHELERELGLSFKEIQWLAIAMNSTRLPKLSGDGKNKKPDCNNTALATVGDAVLKAILSDFLFLCFTSENKMARMGEITHAKERLENNQVLYEVMGRYDLKKYTYNDYAFYTDPQKDHERVGDSKHNQYVEAIIAAIYYDQGFDKTKEWVLNYLLPKMISVSKDV